jgi:hypothetical protein
MMNIHLTVPRGQYHKFLESEGFTADTAEFTNESTIDLLSPDTGIALLEDKIQTPDRDAEGFPAGTDLSFAASEIPYSPDEVGLLAPLIAKIRASTNALVGLSSIARPHTRYPAYPSVEDAQMRLAFANSLLELINVTAMFTDLRYSTCRDPHEEYSRTVQAIQWQKQCIDPSIAVIPMLCPERIKTHSHAAAQFAACYDLGISDIVWVKDRAPDTDENFKDVVKACKRSLEE